ncbi:hypothetical protein C8Q74DRAFT_1312045 [Fomes fomentarius]|nr:hypothetical protein C8Q74DRAFT_1312045 [Fomes fomentarius]
MRRWFKIGRRPPTRTNMGKHGDDLDRDTEDARWRGTRDREARSVGPQVRSCFSRAYERVTAGRSARSSQVRQGVLAGFCG